MGVLGKGEDVPDRPISGAEPHEAEADGGDGGAVFA